MCDHKLYSMIQESGNIVFFGGAGVSTESGIPDYRSTGGLYHQQYPYPPETILSRTFFEQHTEEFFAFYRDKMVHLHALPNAAHQMLTKLEAAGKLRAVITQNVDGLHQMAGSQTVLELHGSIHRNYCVRCKQAYRAEDIVKADCIPRCECGGVIRPDVVLYEETLDVRVLQSAVRYIREAEMLIVGGTSLNVYPAAGLLEYFTANALVIVNQSPTQADRRANLVIADRLGKVMAELNATWEQNE